MEYQEVKCRNCGSPMHVAEDAERIRCPYCGTEYVLKSQCNEKNPHHQLWWTGCTVSILYSSRMGLPRL